VAVNPFSLEGKVALVVGASRGIGLAIARGMAAAGAKVILAARSKETLEQHANELGGTAMVLDIANPESVASLAASIEVPDIVVNVAGMNIRKRFSDFTAEEYKQMMDTNLTGIFQLTQQVGKRMVDRGQGGKIINIGSMMSIRGLPYLSVYALAKGALAQFSMVLAAELGRHNIQVNCIAPGFIVTEFNRKVWESQKLREWLRGVQPNPEPGTPEDVAPLAVFLAGSGSRYITGQVIAVCGGYSTTAVWPFEPA
jgi:gluconate 5-dehydrogenase